MNYLVRSNTSRREIILTGTQCLATLTPKTTAPPQTAVAPSEGKERSRDYLAENPRHRDGLVGQGIYQAHVNDLYVALRQTGERSDTGIQAR